MSFTKWVQGLWQNMNDILDNVHSDKKIKPTDFLWKIQKWAYFGKLWNPKPMNYCPYYWMGQFTKLFTFLIPIIPITHLCYYLWLGIRYCSIKIWTGCLITFSFILNILEYLFSPIGRVLSRIGDSYERRFDRFGEWLDSLVKPIKEERKVKREYDFSKRPMDDFILFYLLKNRWFSDSNAEGSDIDASERVKNKFSECLDLRYDSGYYIVDKHKIIKKVIYNKLSDNSYSLDKKNSDKVQAWIDGNKDWFKKFSKFLDKRYEDYKWRYEWNNVQNEIEDSEGVDYSKFKKFNKEISDLEKIKRRNKIVAKVINFTKMFVKVLLVAIALGILSWCGYLLYGLSKAIWINIGIISGVTVLMLGVLTGLFFLIRYLVVVKGVNNSIIRGFSKMWKKLGIIKVIFLPLIFIVKIVGRRFSMLLDWKKDNCPHTIYEGFDEE